MPAGFFGAPVAQVFDPPHPTYTKHFETEEEPTLMTKLLAMACVAGASLVVAGGWPAVVDAQATRTAVTVSPSSVVPTAQYFSTTHKLAGTGAVVTIRVGPNKVLIPSFPVEVMECDPYPSSQSDCDMETTLPFDELTKKRDVAAANGSVTFHFLVWPLCPTSGIPFRWSRSV